MADQYDKLAPRDLLITLRSLPRRLEGVVNAERQDSRAWAKREQPRKDGTSFVGALAELGLTLAALEAEVVKITTQTDPIIWAAVLDGDVAISEDAPPLSADGGEEMAKSAALAMADRLDNLSGDDWARTASLTGGGTVSVLQLAQQAARTAIGGLRRVESTSNR